MVWGLALLAVVAFALAITSHSPGWMGLGIFIGLVAGIAAALVFIERHVRASSRPEHMTAGEIEALRKTVKKPAPPVPQLPPSQDA